MAGEERRSTENLFGLELLMSSYTNRQSVKTITRGAVVAVLLILVGIANWQTHRMLDYIQTSLKAIHGMLDGAPTERDESRSEFRDFRPWPATGPYHKQLAMLLDLPPIGPIAVEESTPIHPTGDLLDAQQSVIGIVRDGLAVAVPLAALSGPSSHVAILKFRHHQVALTHCNLSNCTRVLEIPTPTPTTLEAANAGVRDLQTLELSDLRVGGVDIEGGLVLLLDDTRYSHRSEKLPLVDSDFEVISFGRWSARHPDTIVVYPAP